MLSFKKIPTYFIKLYKKISHIISKMLSDVAYFFTFIYVINDYLFIASWIATATATVAPTIGLLPIPIRPIIST